jgi:3-hydroxyacyl-[acyl-carrier-protein] dehydratase
MMMDNIEIQEIIPHRFPFLLIDRVVELNLGTSIIAYKNVTIGEQIFQGHFPGHPIYPGVMIIEGMAQAGGVLAFRSINVESQRTIHDKIIYFMSIDNAKFRIPVTPGDCLEYRIEVIRRKDNIWVLDGKAYVNNKLAAEAKLKAMIVDK